MNTSYNKNNPPKKMDAQFIIRVLRNEVTQEEKEFFAQWLNESEKNKSEFAAVSLLWDSADQSKVPDAPDADDQWQKIMQKISSPAVSQQTGEQKGYRTKNSVRWEKESAPLRGNRRNVISKRIVSISGLTLLIAIISISWFVKSRFDVHSTVSQTESSEVVTRNGEKVVITLTDGTIVYLNSGSRLTYPNQFSDSLRLIGLEGEGYFVVAKNPAKPFRIITGNTFTQVTGTEFNIRFRRDSLVVAVTEGSVTVAQQLKSDSVHLQRGDAAMYSNTSNTLISHSRVDVERYIAWRKNKLAFTRAPLQDVMDEIERCFNVNVVFAKGPVRRKTLTGMFSTESLDGILSNIALAMDIHIQRNGKTVLIQ